MFPEYYTTNLPEDKDDLCQVYYKVTGKEDHVFARVEGEENGVGISYYDLWMEDRNGFGIVEVDESETPWADE